jgi:hypothetical protein
MMATQKEIKAVQMVAKLIVESVKDADRGMGVPAGPMYAALMAHGCTLDQFNQLMAALVSVGKLRREGDLYFAV